MVDFTSILSKPTDEIEKPRPKPTGTYQAVVVGMPQQRTVNTKEGEQGVLSFTYKLIAARDDVDEDQLAEHPAIPEWGTLKHDFWLAGESAEYNLKRQLSDVLGIDLKGKTLGEGVAEAPGKGLLVTVKHRPFTRAGATEAEIATEVGGVAAL